MCKVGGPRCDGSHTPSTTQRAKRKANAAYRKQLTAELETRVGDPHLAKQIRHASTTDLHEIAIVAGINPHDIALRCGSATYTSPTRSFNNNQNHFRHLYHRFDKIVNERRTTKHTM